MIRRIAPIVCTVVLILATSAWAQAEIRGVVSYVDPSTRTIYFTDGRSVQLKPGSILTVNGQPAVLESLRPGTTFVLTPPAGTTVIAPGVIAPGASTTTVTVTQQPPAPAPPPAPLVSLPPASPVSVTGTIARTDPLNQTITFQDGRIVKLGPTAMVWQQAPALSTLTPGAQVFVRDATPIGYAPSSASLPAPGQYVMMGTVSRVDPAAQHIVLSNGTVVHVIPGGAVRVGGNPVAFTQLRQGDEILVQVRNPALAGAPATTVLTPAPAERYVGSALPYQSYADTRIEASDVIVLWSPQSR